MGEVVEVGGSNKKLKVGQRVVVPFVIACGDCFFCKKQQFAACDNSNPAETTDCQRDRLWLPDGRGLRLFAPHRRLRRRAGRVRARALRGRRAPRDSRRHRRRQGAVPLGHPAYRLDGRRQLRHRARRRGRRVGLRPGRPVLRYRVRSCWARTASSPSTITRTGSSSPSSSAPKSSTSKQVKVREALAEMTGGIGPDACIDAVGMESHGMSPDNIVDHVKVKTFMATDRIHALAPGDPRDAQGRTCLHSRRLRRHGRQVPDWRAHGEGTHHQERPDARAEVHAGAAAR